MEPGLYVTFFTKDEPASRELPPVGPLDNVVLRQHVLLAERRSVQQAQELGVAIDRWLEAELEIQRAMGAEPGGTKRSERRFSARDGLFLRFVVFGNLKERDLVPELGPYAVVVVSPLTIEADGAILATRAASDLAAWELHDGAGDETIGAHKPDVAFRTSNTGYHPSVAPAPPRPSAMDVAPLPTAAPLPPPPFELPPLEMPTRQQPPASERVIKPAPDREQLFTDQPKKPVEIYSVAEAAAPRLAPEPLLTQNDRAMIDQLDRDRRDETLRARIQLEERKRLGVGERNASASETSFAMRYRNQPENEETTAGEEETGREWGTALWRLRFAILGALLVLAGVYTAVTLRGGIGFGSSGPQLQYVGLSQRISGTHWDYVVNGVQSQPVSGRARATGTFYIVQASATNRAGEGQQLSPASFNLIDASGVRHTPEGLGSDVYAAGSGLAWPKAFPVGIAVIAPLVFDVDPTLPRGMLLLIDELPNLRVRLD